MEFSKEEIQKLAKKELENEQFRDAVEKEKERLRKQKSFWDIIFPFKIIIIKKGE